MTINRNKTTIVLTKKEREAIKTVAKLTHDLYYSLSDFEVQNFNGIMKASWHDNADDTDNIEVGILDLSCLLDDFQENIDKFNNGDEAEVEE